MLQLIYLFFSDKKNLISLISNPSLSIDLHMYAHLTQLSFVLTSPTLLNFPLYFLDHFTNTRWCRKENMYYMGRVIKIDFTRHT